MTSQNVLVGHIRKGKRFFTGKDKVIVASYECKHVNEKSLVGVCEETGEELAFQLDSGQSEDGQEVVYIGAIPFLYDKQLDDARLYVQNLPPVKARL